jgi:hypothetical protein
MRESDGCGIGCEQAKGWRLQAVGKRRNGEMGKREMDKWITGEKGKSLKAKGQ